MINTTGLAYFLIFTPLICAVLNIIFKFLPVNTPKKVYFIISTLGSLVSFAISILLLEYVITYQGYVLEDNIPVCVIQNIALYFGFYLDNTASVFVTLISALFLFINFYSYKYILRGGQGFARYYIYLNLLQFFAVCFFISSNLVQSMVFMIPCALTQYLFVNFYFQKPSSQKDSKKIFEINALADSILLVAVIVFLYFSTLTPDTTNIPTLGYNNINSLGLYSFAGLNPLLFMFVCSLFITGALIKSAQFPFCSKTHLSSQAPNPVFTLFLGPVILGEGIFLILRLFPLINLMPVLFETLKIVGIISALLGALIALKETQTKKILAFASVSQAGLVLMAAGFKMYGASVFHLICTGFTLTLLSLCLSNVSYASGSQENIKFLGGLREKLPSSAYPFLAGAVSLSGFTFSCFYSRAAILNYLGNQKSYIYIFLFLLCSFLTVFYIFRLYFRVFEGEYKGSFEVIKPGRIMNLCVYVLAAIVLIAGFILNNHIIYFISFSGDSPVVQADLVLNIVNFIVCAAGYYLAYKIYFTKQLKSLSVRPLRKIARERFGLDGFINFIFEDAIKFLTQIAALFEKYIIGALYTIPAYTGRFFSYAFNTLQAKKINTQIFAVFSIITFFVMTVIIIYFKTGVLR